MTQPIGEERLVVLADAALLRRAIQNVVDNALRYAGAARISLRIDGRDALFVVEDGDRTRRHGGDERHAVHPQPARRRTESDDGAADRGLILRRLQVRGSRMS